MKKVTRKIKQALSILLAAAMIVTMIPETSAIALAAEQTEDAAVDTDADVVEDGATVDEPTVVLQNEDELTEELDAEDEDKSEESDTTQQDETTAKVKLTFKGTTGISKITVDDSTDDVKGSYAEVESGASHTFKVTLAATYGFDKVEVKADGDEKATDIAEDRKYDKTSGVYSFTLSNVTKATTVSLTTKVTETTVNFAVTNAGSTATDGAAITVKGADKALDTATNPGVASAKADLNEKFQFTVEAKEDYVVDSVKIGTTSVEKSGDYYYFTPTAVTSVEIKVHQLSSTIAVKITGDTGFASNFAVSYLNKTNNDDAEKAIDDPTSTGATGQHETDKLWLIFRPETDKVRSISELRVNSEDNENGTVVNPVTDESLGLTYYPIEVKEDTLGGDEMNIYVSTKVDASLGNTLTVDTSSVPAGRLDSVAVYTASDKTTEIEDKVKDTDTYVTTSKKAFVAVTTTGATYGKVTLDVDNGKSTETVDATSTGTSQEYGATIDLQDGDTFGNVTVTVNVEGAAAQAAKTVTFQKNSSASAATYKVETGSKVTQSTSDKNVYTVAEGATELTFTVTVPETSLPNVRHGNGATTDDQSGTPIASIGSVEESVIGSKTYKTYKYAVSAADLEAGTSTNKDTIVIYASDETATAKITYDNTEVKLGTLKLAGDTDEGTDLGKDNAGTLSQTVANQYTSSNTLLQNQKYTQ
jgi:hypothetical protein